MQNIEENNSLKIYQSKYIGVVQSFSQIGAEEKLRLTNTFWNSVLEFFSRVKLQKYILWNHRQKDCVNFCLSLQHKL